MQTMTLRRFSLHALAAALVALPFTAGLASAQAPATMRVRATIEQVQGDTLMVKTREGSALKVVLAANAPVAAVVKASLSDIKPGTYVGIASMPQPDGSLKALEVLIFPEAMRGTAEGHFAWDLQPNSMMTNANVEQVVTAVDGPTLTLKYKNGEKKIFVPSSTIIVTYTPGNRADLKPGLKIFIAAAKKLPDGSVEAPRLAYGKDGLALPM